VKTNRFQKGDLVLLYTLKKHKCKLKRRGLGPFVVLELNTSGAVRLETLYGVPMGDYINGSHLKRYEEPLTDELIQRLHAAQNRNEREALLKCQAREEVEAWIAKMKVLNIQASALDDLVDPFHIRMQVVTHTTSYVAFAFSLIRAQIAMFCHIKCGKL